MKVWHDPQHGGSNRGTEWHGLFERHWVLDMATDLFPMLGSMGCEQRLARISDVTIPYGDRAQAANEWGANLAILHHANAMVYPEGHEREGQAWEEYDGLMTFVYPGDNVGYEVAEMIGRCAPRGLRQKRPTYITSPDRKRWTNNAHRCLTHYRLRDIPAVLIEWGFATSPRDRSILQSAKHRPALCACVACGIGRFYEVTV